MTKVETIRYDGKVATIHYDEDCSSPRDCDGNFLFLGFPHRSYNIGDETLDPETFAVHCETCDGQGRDVSQDTEPVGTGFGVNGPDCPDCDGEGERRAHNFEELVALVKAHYKAEVVLPVGMIDHSGVSYYIGGGAHWCDPGGWDSGTCGLILDTPEVWEMRGRPMPADDNPETIAKWMGEEIEEYSRWASGDCYGYDITRDPDVEPTEDDIRDWRYEVANGDTSRGLADWLDARFEGGSEADSCWGFIGLEYATSEAKAALGMAREEGT